jgi:hypothetical protein
MHKGSCLCGAVSFEVDGPLHAPIACHCSQCRKQSSHYWAATDVPRSVLRLHGEDKVTWFRSSANVRRGFCSVCGSNLFWDRADESSIYAGMGAFDTPTATHLARHVFVADKGDYYDIADGLPQNAQ